MNAQKFWQRVLFLGYIEVSRSGVVITATRIETEGYATKNGYLSVTMWDRWSRIQRSIGVHRLVWLRYKGRIPRRMEINHIDNDRTNNKLSNLELVTSKGNSDHASRQGRMPRGEQNWKSKLTNAQVVALRLKWLIDKRHMSKNAFAKANAPEGVSFWTVLYAINGNRYKHLAMPT